MAYKRHSSALSDVFIQFCSLSVCILSVRADAASLEHISLGRVAVCGESGSVLVATGDAHKDQTKHWLMQVDTELLKHNLRRNAVQCAVPLGEVSSVCSRFLCCFLGRLSPMCLHETFVLIPHLCV